MFAFNVQVLYNVYKCFDECCPDRNLIPSSCTWLDWIFVIILAVEHPKQVDDWVTIFSCEEPDYILVELTSMS